MLLLTMTCTLQVILDHSENGELHPHSTVSVSVCDSMSPMHS